MCYGSDHLLIIREGDKKEQGKKQKSQYFGYIQEFEFFGIVCFHGTVFFVSMLSAKTKIAFVVTGVFIGALVTAQFKSSVPESSYLYDQLTLQKDLLKSFTDDQAFLKSKIVTLRQKIQENQEKLKTITSTSNLETLKKLKAEIGLEPVQGAGLEITLSDGPFADRDNPEVIEQSLIHASDLRDVVNLLRSSGSDAIAINDQRVIASTAINSVGNTILVNNYHVSPPFVITAVGNPQLVFELLKDSQVLPDLNNRVKSLKVGFSIKMKPNILIPLFNGNFTFRYLRDPLAS